MAVIGLGLAALGRPGYMTVGHADDVQDASEAGMQATAFAVLDEAWERGVRHFDVARSYGLGEAFLSAWLTRSGHQGAQVSSKWGYRYTGGWQRTAAVHEVKEHSLSHLTTQWAETSALLGPWLRTLHIHSLTPDSPALDDQPLLDRLWQLRGTGLTIGASVSGPRQAEVIDRLLTVRRHGERLFCAVQATWNLLERSAGPALQRAHDAGLQVVVKEGLANGRLAPRGDVQPVLEEARRRGTTADALSLAVALAQPFADVVLSGAATKTQVAANLLARNVEVLPDTLTSVTQPAERYWAERSTLRWS